MTVVFAPDLSLTVFQNTPATIRPQLTADGSNVDASSLSIITPASNGVATAALPLLGYTSTLPYYGGDSFQYQGTINGDSVASVTMTNGGTGYTSATVTFSLPLGGGTRATGTATIVGGVITGIVVTNPGAGYENPPTITIDADHVGTDAIAISVLTQIASNVANVNVTVNVQCSELGIVTLCNVSGYQRNRIFESRCQTQEIRCLTANYNGAIPKTRSIVGALWECLNPSVVFMQQADYGARSTSCLVRFQYGGVNMVRCTATLDNGEVMPVTFRMVCDQVAWFRSDTGFSTGPYSLQATST